MVERSVMGQAGLREVGAELRRLRMAAGLSGVEVAARAGVPQPAVSRVETGQRVSSPDIVERIIAALPVDQATAERLAGRVREAYAASVPRRVDAGVSFRPASAGEWAARAQAISDFQSAVIPALLRTPAYAEAAALPGALARPAPVLDDRGKRFTFLVTETALRTWPGTGESMPDQFGHLARAAERPNVTLGIVPGRAAGRAQLPLPLHGFMVYDDQAVTVETFTRTLTLTRPDDVAAYAEAFDAFAAAATFGEDAQALVDQAAAEFHRVWRSIH